MAKFKLSDTTPSVPGQKDIEKSAKKLKSSDTTPSIPGQKDAGKKHSLESAFSHDSEQINVYATERNAAKSRDDRWTHVIWLAVLTVVLLLIAIFIPAGIFSSANAGMSMAEWMDEVRYRAMGFISLITFQGGDYSMDAVTFHFLIVAIAGAALGISGGIYQGTLKNALASPSTLGVMSGANIGRIIYVLFFYDSVFITLGSSYLRASDINNYYASLSPLDYIWAVYGQAICCLVGALVVVVVVLGIANVFGHGRPAKAVMVIAGQVIASVVSVVTQAMSYYYSAIGDDRFELVRELSQASFANTFRLLDIVLMGVPILLIVILIMTQAGKLNLLSFGDEEARSMGVDVTRSRWIIVGGCTAMTAIVVAFCGQIGFVGFLVPHLVRKLVGPDFRFLVPASAFAGASFLVGSYFVISLFDSGVTMSLNMFTSTVGLIAFLVMALAQRGKSRGEWI